MGGTIHFNVNEKPIIGSDVVIIVDSVNHPTGHWSGILTSIEEINKSSWDNNYWANCTAEIINPAGSPIIPRVNYDVYLATSGTDYLIERMAELEKKLKESQKKSRIEKEMFMAVFKSIADPNFADEFKKIMKELLSKSK